MECEDNFQNPTRILIVGEMHIDDEKTIVYVTPGEQMLKILRSKLKEERVQIDVPADALNQWPVNNTLRKTADRQDPAHY